ncbi:hypothetical protein BAE44_0002759 [Dichanthelium oligosanthes]|uniref:Cystatin domain-containing protein n=1 Tax=Dichanthelium oligosanthes TaxID=888268 RepID=A0A1E5WFQ1_9POAL|nr:hypothetical protein BAE44_0002759 [Dichanthelium oligosanthes]
MKTSLVLRLVAIVAAACALAVPATASPTGGWIPIPNINDPVVQNLGGWAVSEHVKQTNDGLKFQKVVSGDQLVAAGLQLRIIIDALSRDGKDGRYHAVVFQQGRVRKLVSFGPAN